MQLAAELFGVSRTTLYNWLKEKKLLSLEPDDIRYMIESRALKMRKGRPRGRPFEGRDDPRRFRG
jgi:predicted site-specific integrase-resolvase